MESTTATMKVPQRNPDDRVETWWLTSEEQFDVYPTVNGGSWRVERISEDSRGEISYFGRKLTKGGRVTGYEYPIYPS